MSASDRILVITRKSSSIRPFTWGVGASFEHAAGPGLSSEIRRAARRARGRLPRASYVALIWLDSPAPLPARRHPRSRSIGPRRPSVRLPTTLKARSPNFLGSDPRAARSLQAAARIERDADNAYRLTLIIDAAGQRAQRSLADFDCGALAQAAALLIAIAIDSDGRSTGRVASAAGRTGSRASADRARSAAGSKRARAGTIYPDSTLRRGARRRARRRHSTVPRFRAGCRAHARLRRDRVAVGGQWLLPRTTEIPKLGGASATLSSAMALARGCVAFAAKPFELGPCAVFELARCGAEHRAIAHPAGGHALWLAFGAGAEARLHVTTRWWVLADAALLARMPSAGSTWATDTGQVAAHEVAAAIGRVSLGIGYEFQ